MKPHEAIILAGGLGTRLREVVSDVPKPMAPVNGRPFLEYLLAYWHRQGIQRFILSVGYRADCIIKHFGNRYCNATIEYAHEPEPLGTGGAVALVLRQSVFKHKHALLLNGDTWFEASLSRLCHDAAACPAPVTLTVLRVEHNDRYGSVEVLPDGHVESFAPPSGATALINTGCYLLDTSAVSLLFSHKVKAFSWENDVLVPAAKGGYISASSQNARFVDIGIPDDYYEFCAMALKTLDAC